MKDVYPKLDDAVINGVKHWIVTNDQPFAIDIEVRTASGTRVIARLPIGGQLTLIPATGDDANMLARPASEESAPLRLV